MAVVTIFSGTFCQGEEVADRVASRLSYERIGNEKLLELASGELGIPVTRVSSAMHSPPLFNSITHHHERSVAAVRLALGQSIERDNVVCDGLAAQLLGKSISHVLRVCLIAKLSHRLAVASELGQSEDEARRTIAREDALNMRWTQHLFSRQAYDPELYDVVLPMDSTDVDEAVSIVCRYAGQPVLRTSQDSERAVRDFILAAQVSLRLAEKGCDEEVTSSDGHISISINRYVVRLSRYKKRLEDLASQVPGVQSVTSRPGTRFVPPSLTRNIELEVPSKVLLVDDEREFVQTLSERLQSRNVESAVVYNGQEALSLLATDEPEVMVLDLKMPGIDGMEVLRRVKRDHPRVEVIILTGHGSDREEKIARELGAFAYLHKPVDLDLLAQVMREAYKKTKESS
ncbi:MAG: response regulator [Acidobacteriota bacterium]